MSITNNPKFKNYMTIWEIKVNEKGTKVSGRGTTSRKKTDFDKFAKGEYINSSWFIDFTNASEAKKLKAKDRIIIKQFSITNGEEYADGKYSPCRMTIWDWEYNDSASGSKSTTKKTEKPVEEEVEPENDEDGDDDIPF